LQQKNKGILKKMQALCNFISLPPAKGGGAAQASIFFISPPCAKGGDGQAQRCRRGDCINILPIYWSCKITAEQSPSLHCVEPHMRVFSSAENCTTC